MCVFLVAYKIQDAFIQAHVYTFDSTYGRKIKLKNCKEKNEETQHPYTRFFLTDVVVKKIYISLNVTA